MKLRSLYKGLSIEKYHFGAILLAFGECIVLTFHWAYFGDVQLHFIALYLLVNEVCLHESALSAS